MMLTLVEDTILEE